MSNKKDIKKLKVIYEVCAASVKSLYALQKEGIVGF